MSVTPTRSYIVSPAQIVALAAIGIFGSLAPFIMPVIVGAIVDHLGITLAQAGYVAFADMTGLGIGAIVWSRLIATANWRRFALLAVGLVIGGNLACTLISDFYTLMGARVVVGLGGGFMLAIGNSGLTMTRNPDRVVGIVTVVAMLSAAAALFGFPLLVAELGVNAVFYGMAIATGVAGLGIARLPAYSPNRAADGDPDTAQGGGAQLDRTGLVALAGVFTFFLGAIIFWVYVERVGNAAQYSVETIATVLGVSNLFGALGAVTPAILSTRLGNRIVPITVCIAIAVAASLLIAADLGVAAFAIAASAFIFAWDCFYPYMMGLLISIDQSGRLVSNGLAVQTVGKAIGPAIAGALIMQIGFAGVYSLAAVLFAISAVFFWAPMRESDRLLRSSAA